MSGRAAAGTIVAVSCGILVVLFLIQRNGTSKIGYAFSPIMLAFLLFNGGVGAYNIGKHGASVFKVLMHSEDMPHNMTTCTLVAVYLVLC
jgi:K+ transporter